MLKKDILRAVDFKNGYNTYFKQDFVNNNQFFCVDGLLNGKNHKFLCKVIKKNGFKHLKVYGTQDVLPEIMLEFVFSSTSMYHTIYCFRKNSVNEYKLSIESIKYNAYGKQGGKND